MMHLPNRSIQSVNIVFSSGAIVMLVVGLIMENWVELIPKIRKDKTTHSPWLGCCPAFWPEDSLGTISSIMKMSLNIAIYLNLILGLQFTSMISQNKCVHLLIGFLSFFTGCLLFYAVTVYHHRLNKGQQMYFVTYKVKWIAFTVYLAIALFLTCGIFCFMQCTNKCACLKFCIPSSEVSSRRLSGSSIQVISLPERTTMPRSIVHVHSMTSNEGNFVYQEKHSSQSLSPSEVFQAASFGTVSHDGTYNAKHTSHVQNQHKGKMQNFCLLSLRRVKPLAKRDPPSASTAGSIRLN